MVIGSAAGKRAAARDRGRRRRARCSRGCRAAQARRRRRTPPAARRGRAPRSAARRRARSRPPTGSAARSSAAAAAMPASAARCARRIPASSAGDFTRRRDANVSWSTRSSTPSARSRSATATGRSGGHAGGEQPCAGDHPRDDLELGLVTRHARRATRSKRPELVDADELGVGPHRGDPLALERVREDDRPAVRLEVGERVDDRQRHLVAQRGRAPP